jgi:hypothetical protein
VSAAGTHAAAGIVTHAGEAVAALLQTSTAKDQQPGEAEKDTKSEDKKKE